MRAVALASLCLVIACGPHAGPNHPASPWSAPSLFAAIPADTPYVVASIDQLDEALRARVYRGVGSQLAKLIANADKLVKAEDEPWKRAIAAVIDSLRGTNLDKWYDTVGLGASPRFALYGLGLYPVFRAELADAAKLRAIATKAIAAAGSGIATNTLGGVTYWTIADGASAKDPGTLVMAVVNNELVVAYMQSSQVKTLLPQVLGLERPPTSLADVMTVPDTLKKYAFNHTFVAQLDTGRLATVLSQAPNSPVGDPSCKDDLARLSAYAPRMVAGYRHLDADGYALGFVVETSPAIAAVLAKVRTAMPQMPREGSPMFELAAGVDVDAMIDAVRTAVHQFRNQPLRCGAFTAMSEALDELGQKLDEPLPPEMRGLRGYDLVVDDFSMSPPGGRGGVLVLGAHLADALTHLVGKVPGLGMLTFPNDGSPVELPVAMLGIPDLSSAHVAVRDGVAALAVDPHSKERVVKALAATPDPKAPFVSFAWDIARTLERFPTLWDADTVATMRNMKRVDMSLELRDNALDFELDAGWP